MIAIELRNIRKTYKLSSKRPLLLKSLFVPAHNKTAVAIKNLSLTINRGECVGIIGDNGSGKSTLLKVIAGITSPDNGVVIANGRICSLIELGAGFHQDLSGKENIFLNGILLGFTKKELMKRYSDIVSFSGIGEYIAQPIRTFSSGMIVRLGFAIAIHLDPDILLIDEVLAVGDEKFQRKSLRKMEQLKEQGKSLILVSHNLPLIEQFCSKVFYMHKGELLYVGAPEIAIRKYIEMVNESKSSADNEFLGKERYGTKEIEITKIKLFNTKKRSTNEFITGEDIIIEATYRTNRVVNDACFGFSLVDLNNDYIFGTNTSLNNYRWIPKKGVGKIIIVLDRIALLKGKYFLSMGIAKNNDWHKPIDQIIHAVKFNIKETKSTLGLEGKIFLETHFQQI